MRIAFFVTTLLTLLSSCDLVGGGSTCASDDDCDGRDRCEAGDCVTPRRDRGEGEEGEGEEGEGEGEGENPIADVLTATTTVVREPVTCAGETANAALTMTANAALPAAIVVEVALPTGVSTRTATSVTIAPGSTATLLLDVQLGFVADTVGLPIEINVVGAGTVITVLNIELFADSSNDVEGAAPAENDVLLVVENSGSMTTTVGSTGLDVDVTGSGGFVDDLFARGGAGLRVAVIDANPASESTHGVARRCTTSGSGPVLTTADNVRCTIDALWSSFDGSGTEESLAPILAWLGPRDVSNGSMLRPGARFTVMSIGDSDDQGDVATSSIIASLQGLVPVRSSDVTVHALRADGEGCGSGNTNVRVDAVVSATGGLIGDVCNAASRAGFFAEVLADVEVSSSLIVDGLPASGDVVVCVDDGDGDGTDTCVIVPDAAVRSGADAITLQTTLPVGAVRVLTAPTCSL